MNISRRVIYRISDIVFNKWLKILIMFFKQKNIPVKILVFDYSSLFCIGIRFVYMYLKNNWQKHCVWIWKKKSNSVFVFDQMYLTPALAATAPLISQWHANVADAPREVECVMWMGILS